MASPAREAANELDGLVGSTVAGKYRIERLIGRGGMGAVFQATNVAIGKRVALKFLEADAGRDGDAATRFQREAEAASLVESAHIVQIFDSGTTDDGIPFLVMELLTGEDLRARLKRDGRLAPETVRRIGAQVLKALVRAHAAGIVHRDLKPDNVFLCRRDDDPEFVKIVDFGISKLSRAASVDTLTQKGTVLGTAFYMSPEQAQSFADIDGRTDLFSLGTILYEALAGRPPHGAPTYEAVLIGICTRDAPDLLESAPDVPEELARVVHKALARDREQRFHSASEMLEALESLDGEPLGSRNGAKRPRAARPAPGLARAGRYRTVVAGLVAALSGFALAAYFVGRARSESRHAPPIAAGEPAPRGPLAPSSTPTPEPEAPPPVTSKAPAPGTAEASPAAPPRAPAAPSAKVVKAAAKATPLAAKPPSGVARGLQISTKEP